MPARVERIACEPKVVGIEPSGASVQAASSRVVLVGTMETLAELRAQAAAAGLEPRVSGTLLLRDDGSLEGSLGGAVQAIVCVPESRAGERVKIVDDLRARGVSVRCTSPMSELAAPVPGTPGGDNQWRAAPTIDLAQLIGRTPRALDRDAIAKVLTGKRVLITGAGGSIGSHLAQVAAEFNPASIMLVERSENALFEIDRQLARRFPGVARRAILHDVVDSESTLRHLMALSPQVLFHAAAHKHVPLMEDHPAHAVANNVLGTKSIADAAVACGAERFVMISSDKAVNPASVMGATKRLAEIYVRWLGSAQERPRMSMVRFGNVLGSACSVLTIWSSQIAEGGPVTVTDPRMTRYFMTIPEAAALVIASTTLDDQAPGGVFVLDMGEPIRILDLARRFVLAHGLRPRLRYSTIPEGVVAVPLDFADEEPGHSGAPTMDIVFTGSRPGEKVHEELAYAAEHLAPTEHPGIRAWSGLERTPDGRAHSDGARFTRLGIERMLAELREACAGEDPGAVVSAIERHVPEMQRKGRANAA